jgi:hypothetical protein
MLAKVPRGAVVVRSGPADSEPVLFDEIVVGTKLRCDPDHGGQTVGVGLFVDGTGKCIPASVNLDQLDREIATASRIGANFRDDHLLKLSCCSALSGHAWVRTEALSRKEGHLGAVAFSRTGDPATGDFSDAKVIRKFGNVPDDLSAL